MPAGQVARDDPERELVESWRRLSPLLDCSPNLVWTVDARRFSLLTFNRALQEYYLALSGLTLRPGMELAEIQLTAEAADRWRGYYERTLEGGCLDLRRTLAGGRTLDLHFEVLREGGSAFAIAAFGRDITLELRAEAELRSSEEKYRRLVEQVPLGIYRRQLDPEGPYLYVNPGHLRQFECETVEAFNARYGRVRDRWARPEEYDAFAARLRAERRIEGHEVEVRLAGGGRRWLSLYVYLEDDGRTVCGFSLDITAQKQAEVERARLAEALHCSRKLEALGQLAGGVAHDFNNLLTIVRADVSFALQVLPEGAEAREPLSDVLEASERAAALTRQLLAFGRKQVLHPSPLDLNRVVVGMEKMLRRLVGAGVELRVVPGADLGPVLADPVQVEQVLLNLVINARDAMPRGGTVTMRTSAAQLDGDRAAEAGVAPGAYLVLSVADTGAGMDEATRAHIFEPFFTTKVAGEGTGLGLATVHGIAKQSGGGVVVRSAPGAGATFEVVLPQLEGVAAAPAAPVPSQATAGSETILVVEDDPTVREICRRALEACGYAVLTAAGPGEALLTCEVRGDAVDLLLADAVLPHLDGVSLAGRLTRRHPHMRTLVMKGVGLAEPEPGGQRLRLLQKPFTIGDLTTAVRDALNDPAP